MWWSEYHRAQALTLVKLAKLARDPDTAESLKRLADRHTDMADSAEYHEQDER
jgi:hypothetical protein